MKIENVDFCDALIGFGPTQLIGFGWSDPVDWLRLLEVFIVV